VHHLNPAFPAILTYISVVARDAGVFESEVGPLSPLCPAAKELFARQSCEFTVPDHFIDASTNSTDDASDSPKLTTPVRALVGLT
jgi:hypothetical protein